MENLKNLIVSRGGFWSSSDAKKFCDHSVALCILESRVKNVLKIAIYYEPPTTILVEKIPSLFTAPAFIFVEFLPLFMVKKNVGNINALCM